jgi:hypothetical protein
VSAQVPPHRTVWPFTDNGAMLEAILELDPGNRPSRCGNARNEEFYPCFHQYADEVSGISFDGKASRPMYGKVLLSHSIDGFNNHKCKNPPEWGWDQRACFNPGQSMVVHTKYSSDAPEENRQCEAAKQLNDRNFIRQGTLMVLPDSDELCYLEDAPCKERAKKYLNIS